MSAMRKMTTVLIGCGGRGVRAHGAWARQSEKLDLLAVCDVDEVRLRATAEALGVPGEQDYRRLLARDDVQSAIVATNARWHAPIALDAVRAGKHVLVEKPLADTARSARQLADAAQQAGVVGMVGYQFRLTGFAEALKREAEAVEPVQVLVTRQRGTMGPQYFFSDHYGGIVDTATHDVHLALWLMGGEPNGVYGTVTRGTVLGDQTIEFMNVLVDYDGGGKTATVVSSMFGMQTQNIVQVVGTKGTVTSLDRKTLRVVRHESVRVPGPRAPIPGLEARTIETEGEPRDATGAMLDHFADLASGRATEQRGTTLREGTYAVAVTEAMVRAAESGRRVALDEVL